MRALRFNHVSISAPDVEASTRFYEDVFGMERIATYNFAFPVQYLRLGEQQLHLFQREADAPLYHHFALDVDDFEGAYEKAQELGIQEEKAFFSHAYELPDGTVQMYLRDPGGNLLEIDWPDVSTLDRTLVTDIEKLSDKVAQSEEARAATLYVQPGSSTAEP